MMKPTMTVSQRINKENIMRHYQLTGEKLGDLKQIIQKHQDNHKRIQEEAKKKLDESRQAFFAEITELFDATKHKHEEIRMIPTYMDTLGFAILEVFNPDNAANPSIVPANAHGDLPKEVQDAIDEAEAAGQTVTVEKV
jgi:hypothetical protein